MSTNDFERVVRASYERNRLRNAIVLALPVLLFPMLGCCLGTAAQTACVVGALLVIAGTWALWRGQAAGRAWWPGLLAGMVPLALALAARSYGHVCLRGSCTSLCVPACALGGVVAGLGVAYAARKNRAPATYAVTGALAAMLVGCLGCSCVGFAGMASLVAGLVVSLGSLPLIHRHCKA